MKANRDGVRGDPEDGRDLLIAELLPGDEAEDLLIGGREPPQSREGRSVAVLARAQRRGDVVLGAQERRQPLPPTRATALVRKNASRNRVEPRQRLAIGLRNR